MGKDRGGPAGSPPLPTANRLLVPHVAATPRAAVVQIFVAMQVRGLKQLPVAIAARLH